MRPEAGAAATEAPAPVVLLVDDDLLVREALRTLFADAGYRTVSAATPAEALAAIARQPFDVVVCDMNFVGDTTSGREGESLLQLALDIDPSLGIILLTAWGTIDAAVRCMQAGAFDYLTKPWDSPRLLQRAGAAVAQTHTRRLLRDAPSGTVHGTSAAMRRVLALVDRVAGTDVPVLLTGEPGTGKTSLARIIHERSARASGAFVTADLAAISDTLFERELFGHVRGAFTDAGADRPGRCDAAAGGTLFLDEIGSIGERQQASLLRLLQSGDYEPLGSTRTRRLTARLVAATNADLAALVEARRFREDLWYRLDVVRIHMPPLRERPDDILPLAASILRQVARRHGREVATLREDAADAVRTATWPGNIRELAHALERAVLLADGPELTARDLWPQRHLRDGTADTAPAGGASGTLEAAERQTLLAALRAAQGNVSRAARTLGITRQSLYRRLDAHGLQRHIDPA